MFSTNNGPDLYVLTLYIIFSKMWLVFSTAPRNISEFEWKL